MTKKQVISDFENNILTITGRKNENEIQGYFESNPDLIPTPFLLNHGLHFSSIISKLPISDSLISDFAYLTKSSAEWVLVLMELEASNKKIFTASNKNINFTAEFNNAYDQILSWRAYLEQNSLEFKKKFEHLMFHMYPNSLSFKFVLVIGRSSEINTQERQNLFLQKNKDGVIVMTYDSLLRTYAGAKRHYKNILVKVKNGFELRRYDSNVQSTLFSYVKHGNFFFDSTTRGKLITDGYDIDSWEKGNPLAYNMKYPIKVADAKLMTDETED